MMEKTKAAIKWVVLTGFVAIALVSCGTASILGSTPGTNLIVNGTVPGALSARAVANRATGGDSTASVDIPVEYPSGTAVGIINLTIAKVVVKEIQFEQDGLADDAGEFEFNGPFIADLVANTLDPQPATTDLPSGTYTQVEFKIDKVEGDEEDETGTTLVVDTDPLFGHSILLEGSYTPTGGVAVPFTYTFDIDAEFQLKGVGDTAVGFDITAGGVNDVIIAFRLNKWFTGRDPAAFAADPAAFSEDLKENIKQSADYGKDSDGDGILSSDEDDDPDSEDDEDA
ncbi:MAG: hypothetical protein ABIJ86_14720 [Spirochaetota bacterium]